MQVNNWIEFKFKCKTNGLQFAGEGIEKLLVNVVLKKNCKNTEIQKTQIHASLSLSMG
jgi:hypothetical protein